MPGKTTGKRTFLYTKVGFNLQELPRTRMSAAMTMFGGASEFSGPHFRRVGCHVLFPGVMPTLAWAGGYDENRSSLPTGRAMPKPPRFVSVSPNLAMILHASPQKMATVRPTHGASLSLDRLLHHRERQQPDHGVSSVVRRSDVRVRLRRHEATRRTSPGPSSGRLMACSPVRFVPA